MKTKEEDFAFILHNTLRIAHLRLETCQFLTLAHHNFLIVASLPQTTLAILKEPVEITLTGIHIIHLQLVVIVHDIDTKAGCAYKVPSLR